MLTKDHAVQVIHSGARVPFIYRGDRCEQVEEQTHETEHERSKNTDMKTGFLFRVLPNHWGEFVTNLEEWAKDKNINLGHDDEA